MCSIDNCTATKIYVDDRCYRHCGKQHAKSVNVEENIVEVIQPAEVMTPIPDTYIDTEIIQDFQDIDNTKTTPEIEDPAESDDEADIEHDDSHRDFESAELDFVECGTSSRMDCLVLDFSPEMHLLFFNEFIAAWVDLASQINHHSGDESKCEEHDELGFPYSFKLKASNDNDELVGSKYFYFKTPADRATFKQLYENTDFLDYCQTKRCYDERLYRLCCMLKKSWFDSNQNLWNLAGMLYRRQHADIDLMRRTYVCVLAAMTDRFDYNAALKESNGWRTQSIIQQSMRPSSRLWLLALILMHIMHGRMSMNVLK